MEVGRYLLLVACLWGPIALGTNDYGRFDHCALAVLQPGKAGRDQLNLAEAAIAFLLSELKRPPEVYSLERRELHILSQRSEDIEEIRQQASFANPQWPGLRESLWREALGLLRAELTAWQYEMQSWPDDPRFLLANVVEGNAALAAHFTALERAVEEQASLVPARWDWRDKGWIGFSTGYILSVLMISMLNVYVAPPTYLEITLGAAALGGAVGALTPLPPQRRPAPPLYTHFNVGRFDGDLKKKIPLWEFENQVWEAYTKAPIYYLRVMRHAGKEVLLVLFCERGTFKLLQLARWLPRVGGNPVP